MNGLEERLAQRRDEAIKKKTVVTSIAPSSESVEPHVDLTGERDPDAIIVQVAALDIRPQIREHFDDEALEQLAEDILEHGQDAPVLVHRLDDGRYELVDGERRVRAKEILRQREPGNINHTIIRATVKDIPEDVRRLRQLAANIQRENLRPIEEARALAAIKKELGFTDAELATRINKSQSYVSRALALLKFSEPLQYLVESGAVGRRMALSKQDDILQAQIDNLSVDLKARIETGEISVIEAFQRQETTADASVSINLQDTPPESKPAIPKSPPKVSISLKAATDLADLLAILATDLDLAPVKLTKQKGKPVRKELLATLEQRTAEIKQAFKKRH